MPDTTELPITLRLSSRARATLLRQARDTGKDISQLASDLIEHIVTRPSIDDIMAPVHHQTAASGMSDQEIDDFLRSELEAHRREKKAKSA
jgi:hypothetical protein